MATLTKVVPRPADTRVVSGPALDAVIEEVLRPVPRLMRRLMSHHLERAITGIRTLFPTLEPSHRRDPYLALISGAIRAIERAENRIQEIDSHLGLQEAALRFAGGAEEREATMVETLKFLRRTPEQLRGDRGAMKRWMDWEAVLEIARRAQRSARRYQQTLVYLAARGLARCGPDRGRTAADVMELTGFTTAFHRALEQRLPVHLEREWIEAVVAVLRAHRNPKRGIVVDPGILHALAVRAQNPWADVWVQCHSLMAWLLASPTDALRLARQRLRNPDPKIRDDIFVRRYVVEKCHDVLDEMQGLDIVQAALSGPDPSPHVRQGAILSLADRDPEKAWPILREHYLMREEWDPVPEVRAAVSVTLGKWAMAPRGAEIALQEWRLYFERESEAMPLVVAMRHAGNALEQLVGFGHLDPKLSEQFAVELLEKAVQRGWTLPVRAACEDMLERVRVAGMPAFASFRDNVVHVLAERNREDQVDVFVDDPELDDDTFGRLLAWLSRRTYGLYAMRRRHGWRVTVGHQRRWRLWRFIHETLNPAPDKRQAHSHVSARRYEGTIRAHAVGLAEESPTKVPGEPVQMPAEGGWRRWLPLPDDFLDSLEFGPVRIYSSQGIATIEPPKDPREVRRLRWRVSRLYPELSALREQSRYGNPEAPPCAFVERLRRFGFVVNFLPHVAHDLSLAVPYFYPPLASPAAGEAIEGGGGEAWPEEAVAAGQAAFDSTGFMDPAAVLDFTDRFPGAEPVPPGAADLPGDEGAPAAGESPEPPPGEPGPDLVLPESALSAPASDPLADWDAPALPAAPAPGGGESAPSSDPLSDWDAPPALPPAPSEAGTPPADPLADWDAPPTLPPAPPDKEEPPTAP
jgi:hypothetical protein